jgi:arsenite methyltransferase
MDKSEVLKETVKHKYGGIAESSSSCCGGRSSCGPEADYTNVSEGYKNLPGYNPDADLGLGCGLPTELAHIKDGDTVVDLGSGAGNDVFIARSLTGAAGKVIGLDFTDEMIMRARANNAKLGYENIEFVRGDIENIPLESNSADVVISNCVLNLVPDKKKAFSGIYRALKPGGHFSISDIMIKGELPEAMKSDAEMYAGCVSGAIAMDDYIAIIQQTGFSNIRVQRERVIHLPDSVLLKYMTPDELADFRRGGNQVVSVNVYGEKPSQS